MKALQNIYILFLAIFVSAPSCRSYRVEKPENIDDFLQLETTAIYDISDFRLYVLNICELYGEKYSGTKRFMGCPENFHDISDSLSTKKVEELYLLKHRNNNLVLYLTTDSHRFIRPQRGFLNDRQLYDGYYYISDLEYIYVAKVNYKQDSIIFTSQVNDSDMIWSLPSSFNSTQFKVDTLTATTVENRDNPNKLLYANNIFSIPLSFTSSALRLHDKANLSERVPITKIILHNAKPHKAVVIFVNNKNLGYRFPFRQVRFYPQL